MAPVTHSGDLHLNESRRDTTAVLKSQGRTSAIGDRPPEEGGGNVCHKAELSFEAASVSTSRTRTQFREIRQPRVHTPGNEDLETVVGPKLHLQSGAIPISCPGTRRNQRHSYTFSAHLSSSPGPATRGSEPQRSQLIAFTTSACGPSLHRFPFRSLRPLNQSSFPGAPISVLRLRSFAWMHDATLPPTVSGYISPFPR